MLLLNLTEVLQVKCYDWKTVLANSLRGFHKEPVPSHHRKQIIIEKEMKYELNFKGKASVITNKQ